MAENSQAVIPDNLIIVDGEIGGGLPSSTPSDAGKVLTVDGEGSPEWVTPSGGTQYSEGTGIDISDQNVISIDTSVVATQSDLSGLQVALTAGTGIDITNDTISVDTSVIATQNDLSGLQPSLTAGDNISISNNTISATDTTYTAGSGLSLTGTEFAIDTTVVATKTDLPSNDELLPSATSSDEGKVLTIDSQGEAGWSTPASVDEVPAVTSTDDGKVLKATYSGGVGSYAWATESAGTTYTAGTGIDITSGTISVDTTVVATQTDLSGIEQVPTVSSTDDGKVLTATYSGGTGSFAWATPSGGGSGNVNEVFNWSTVAATDIATCLTNGHNPIIQYVPYSDTTKYAYLATVEVTSSGTAYSFYTPVSGSAGTGEKYMTSFYLTTWGTKSASQVTVSTPASSSTDSGKVLTVNPSGYPVWSTPSGGTTYTAGNMISLANDAVAVSTTAGITDIQLVNALPASPVATVLYLIPET